MFLLTVSYPLLLTPRPAIVTTQLLLLLLFIILLIIYSSSYYYYFKAMGNLIQWDLAQKPKKKKR